jgi:hypothetical protein
LRHTERLRDLPSRRTEAASGDTGLRDSFRWKLARNAVNVRQSEWLGNRFLEPLTWARASLGAPSWVLHSTAIVDRLAVEPVKCLARLQR